MAQTQPAVDTQYKWAELHQLLDLAVEVCAAQQAIRAWLFETERAYPVRYVRLDELRMYCEAGAVRWYIDWLIKREGGNDE